MVAIRSDAADPSERPEGVSAYPLLPRSPAVGLSAALTNYRAAYAQLAEAAAAAGAADLVSELGETYLRLSEQLEAAVGEERPQARNAATRCAAALRLVTDLERAEEDSRRLYRDLVAADGADAPTTRQSRSCQSHIETALVYGATELLAVLDDAARPARW